ncbi:serine acetyltransferase 3 [Striga asiatica]|uniref:Serine acetyltransferase 3 n=1 Tax=Striga asiatica TaxID=4170 RepID=A0A5A7R260_STRAF|nr:serine acetyltransferase 3 [Striga asiatica]
MSITRVYSTDEHPAIPAPAAAAAILRPAITGNRPKPIKRRQHAQLPVGCRSATSPARNLRLPRQESHRRCLKIHKMQPPAGAPPGHLSAAAAAAAHHLQKRRRRGLPLCRRNRTRRGLHHIPAPHLGREILLRPPLPLGGLAGKAEQILMVTSINYASLLPPPPALSSSHTALSLSSSHKSAAMSGFSVKYVPFNAVLHRVLLPRRDRLPSHPRGRRSTVYYQYIFGIFCR